MPQHSRIRPANYITLGSCLGCQKPLTREGYCRTRGCPNHFPDPAESRLAALTLARNIATAARQEKHS